LGPVEKGIDEQKPNSTGGAELFIKSADTASLVAVTPRCNLRLICFSSLFLELSDAQIRVGHYAQRSSEKRNLFEMPPVEQPDLFNRIVRGFLSLRRPKISENY
jgi:hypothetical protein